MADKVQQILGQAIDEGPIVVMKRYELKYLIDRDQEAYFR